jgi:hypothetical protein
LVAKAIAKGVGVPVRTVVAAHSGAAITDSRHLSRTEQKKLTTPGEIPNTYPTIDMQIAIAAAKVPRGEPVDLVLVGGCINDVGVMEIINPVNKPVGIMDSTRGVCNEPVSNLLQKVGSRFPNSRIVLTGYFPIVSNTSDVPELGALLASLGVVAGSGSSALGIPVLDPVTGAIGGLGLTEAARRLAAMNAHAFYVASTNSLAMAARSANNQINGRVSFACPPFTPDNAYGSPDTWLWSIPNGGSTNDEVYQIRVDLCANDNLLITAGSTPEWLPLERLKCKSASMGHPNLLGSKAYAQAIMQEIKGYIPYWRIQFSHE